MKHMGIAAMALAAVASVALAESAAVNLPTLKHILGGIQYALRDISTDETPSSPQFVNPPSKK